MTTSGSFEQEIDSKYPRLEQQIKWYDHKSIVAGRLYKSIKFAEMVLAAIIPITTKANPNLAAWMGIAIVICEALQQINQWSQNWITYRSTCEALRHEKYSYIGRSGVYEGRVDVDAMKILIGRAESLISTEHAKWISRQEYETKNNTSSQEI